MQKKKLSEELVKYGYVFSLPKTIITYLVFIGFFLIVGMIFKLDWLFVIALCVVSVFILPLYLRNYNVNRYELKRFSDVNIYMEQFMYSFIKTGKILSTLDDVLELFEEGKMCKTIKKAKQFIEKTYEENDVLYKGLRIIEKEYPYEGIKTMHNFAVQVEEKGGEYVRNIKLLLEARRMWADRIYEQMKVRRHQRVLVLMSIGTSLVLCLVIYVMSDRLNISVSSSNISQIITFIVIFIDMWIYYFADKKLSVGFLSEDVKTDEVMVAKMKRFKKYSDKKATHFLSYMITKKQLTRQLEKEFPRWLMNVSLLLQNENVQVAIFKSVGDAPKILEEDLSKLSYELKKNPISMKPYNDFLSEFDLPEVRSTMKMLYSLSEGTGARASEQIEDIIRRNQIMLDKSEKIKMEDASSGMYALFLAPQLTGGMKLVVDMVLLLVMYMSNMAT